MILTAIMTILSAALLAAHFFRGGNLLLVVLCVATPYLMLIRKRRALHLLQFLTFLGAAVWIYTAVLLVRQRLALGLPFRGVIVILGAVTVVTFITGLLQNSSSMQDRYPN